MGQGPDGHGQVPGRAGRRCPARSGRARFGGWSPSRSVCCCVAPIDPDRPLSDYGLDSLGNLELRTRIETETGVRISPTHITTVRGLADHLCDQLASHGTLRPGRLLMDAEVDGSPKRGRFLDRGEQRCGVGPLASRNAGEWEPSAGSAVSWQPTAAALAKAAEAPVSDVPVSYMQAQHIRGYYDQKAKRARLLAADDRQLRRSGSVRHPCDELRDQRASAAARHVPQPVRVLRRRTDRPAHDGGPRRHRVRPDAARRADAWTQAARSRRDARRIRCSGTASGSGSFRARTTSRSSRSIDHVHVDATDRRQ